MRIKLTTDLIIMFILAILICKVSSLLTFQEFQLYSVENAPTLIAFYLTDENLKPVEYELALFIQVEPMIPLYILPSSKFISYCSMMITFSDIGSIYLKFSCLGCETYTTSYISNSYSEENIITLEPSTTKPQINEKITINYSNSRQIPFSTIYLLTGEEIEFTVSNSGVGSGVAYVTIFSCGEKTLLFYFEDFTMTNIGGITVEVISSIYSSIVFTSSIVWFI